MAATSALAFLAACGPRFALDIGDDFDALRVGDTIEEAGAKLKMPLGKPASVEAVLGFRRVEYRIADVHAKYVLVFAAAPAATPRLVQKAAISY